MKYRTQLYIYIGALFLVVMVGSYFVEKWYIDKDLISGRIDLREQGYKNAELMRIRHEQYMQDLIGDLEAKVEAQVYELNNYVPLQQTFIDKGAAWVSSATYIVTTMWIELIQIGPNENMTSLVIMKEGALNPAGISKDPSGLTFCHMNGRRYVGIPIRSKDIIERSEDLPAKYHKKESVFYALYEPKDLIRYRIDNRPFYLFSIQSDPLQPFFNWVPVKMEMQSHAEFLISLKKAQDILRVQPGLLKEKSIQAPIRPVPFRGQEEEKISTYEQLGMIWALSTFSVNEPTLIPKGIARQEEGGGGLGLLSDEVFFKKPQIAFATKKINEFTLLSAPNLKRFFFGEIVKLYNGQEVSIGIDGEEVLRQISKSTGENTLFFSGDQFVAAYNTDGKKMFDETWAKINRDQLGNKRSGFLKIDGVEYYFMHLKPLKNADFHFYLFKPKAEAFAIVLGVDAITGRVINHVGWLLRGTLAASLVLLLVLLHFLAKKVTGRITVLSAATEKMAGGHYEDVHLPEIQDRGKDEITKLYVGFKKMLQGMIEKEKVRGVLNKVVSSEIAEEILKGDVALGGEERSVTVLFADIRSFTSVTESMAPADTIKMLNQCMTRWAKIIDAHGGVIDKFVGDEVMALFGVPIEKSKSCLCSVMCALEMLKDMQELNRQRQQEGMPEIMIGVGIHKGPMIAGNMGAENRLNYTVIGANVNLAARLCSAAKPMELLISEEVLREDGVSEAVHVKEEKEIELKGFSHPIKVFSIDS